MYISGIWGAISPGRIEPKLFLEEDVPDVITCFKFGDDRLRGLASAEGRISPFPIDFEGRPYNTLTLPCERVMWPLHRNWVVSYRLCHCFSYLKIKFCFKFVTCHLLAMISTGGVRLHHA